MALPETVDDRSATGGEGDRREQGQSEDVSEAIVSVCKHKFDAKLLLLYSARFGSLRTQDYFSLDYTIRK